MTRQVLNRGTTANDGEGDTLRAAAQKINDNFGELYAFLSGDSDTLTTKITYDSDGIIFEGSSIGDGFQTKLTAVDPTSSHILSLPDDDGEFVLTTGTQTLTNKTIPSPILSGVQINDTSADHKYTIGVSELTADRTATLPLLTGNDEFTFNAQIQTLTNKTLTTPTITTPKITNSINDANNNEIINFSTQGSAVNHITIQNGSAGNNPMIKADGDTNNLNLELHSNGEGSIALMSRVSMSSQSFTSDTGDVNLNEPVTFFERGSAISADMGEGAENAEMKHLVNIGSGTATVDLTGAQQDTSRNRIVLTSGQTATLVYSTSVAEWFLVGGTATITTTP
jgi:hypothetical protein